MPLKILQDQEIEDLLRGAEVLGCGGGGEMKAAQKMVREVRLKGKKFKLIDPKDFPNDDYVCIVGSVGGGVSEKIKKKTEALPREQNTEIEAVEELSRILGKEITAFLATEIGPGNTIMPLYVGAMTNRPAIDADCCGRAKPEIAISTTHVKGVPITPLAIITPFGERMVLKTALNDYRAEEICREIAILSGGICHVARCPARGSEIKSAIIPNSISKTIKIGNALRKAHDQGIDPVEALLNVTQGIKFFEGEIAQFSREEKGGFMWGHIKISGSDDYTSRKVTVWFKNEFLIVFEDKTPLTTCPDAICIVDSHTGRGLSCWEGDFQMGREVVAFAIPANELWRTRKGLELFSPKHFGFDFEYTPIKGVLKDI